MPWHLEKTPDGKKGTVVTTATGRKHSKKPIPIARAKAQLAALNIKEKQGKIR